MSDSNEESADISTAVGGPFVQQSSNIFAENRLLKFTVSVIGLCSVVSTYMSYSALTYQTVVLVPPQVNQKMWVNGNKASSEYVDEFSRYVASLALSYTYGLGKEQFSVLLTIFHPSMQQEAKRAYYALADRLDETRAAQSFYISKIVNDESKKTIELTGLQRTYIGDRLVEDVQKTYVMAYAIDAGKFQLMQISDSKDPALNKKAPGEK